MQPRQKQLLRGPGRHSGGLRTCFAVALVLLGLLLSACGVAKKAGDVLGGGSASKTLRSTDGALEMKVPSSWRKVSNLNRAAALQAADPSKEAYGLVVADPKAPFAGTALGQFADTESQKLFQSIGDRRLSGPKLVTVDGKDALQYELRGVVDNLQVVYLYTFAETPDRFLKVLTWSLASNFDKNKRSLQDVTSSVRQLKALPKGAQAPGVNPPRPEPTNLPASILERPV